MTATHSIYRNKLPQLTRQDFIADGGLETVFVFQKNIDLPLFAAISLVNSDPGIAALKGYYRPYIDLAIEHGAGIILDTPTWRAGLGWAEQLGYSASKMRQLNQLSVEMLVELRDRFAAAQSPMVINGVVGPQGDGYNPAEILDAAEAEIYHRHQVESFADSAADMITAVTMTYTNEAIGITRAAAKAGMPIAVSFTVETDGRLPDGTSLRDAILTVDKETRSYPVYYMINCAHPSHFSDELKKGSPDWLDRIYGIRANASCKSHAELDESVELDDGDPDSFGQLYAELGTRLKNLSVVGGCCGTDHRHVGNICQTLMSKQARAS